MRGACLLAVGLVLWIGCRSEVSEPELSRPLEAMPQGACVLMLASDLANLWERAEAHEAAGVLGRNLPAEVMAPPELVELRSRLEAFEQQTGVDLRADLLLPMLRRRVAVGIYPQVAGDDMDLLFVAELDDAEHFRTSLDRLLQAPDAPWKVEPLQIDGRPAQRLRDGGRVDLLLLQEQDFLVGSTQKGLIRSAMAIRQGHSETSALRDSLCVQALEELGPHSVAVVELQRRGRTPWGAKGFTWNRDGVHFKRVVPAIAEPPDQGDTQWMRDEILGSIPTGMTLAYYARPGESSQLRELFRSASCLSMHSSATPEPPLRGSMAPGSPGGAATRLAGGTMRVLPAVDTPLGLDRMPFELVKDISRWAGDEMALVVEALLPTTLAPVPSAALIIEAQDAAMAAQSLRGMESGLPALPFLRAQDFVDVAYGGRTFRSLTQPVLEVLAPSYLVDDDVVIVTSTRELMQRIIDTRRVGRRSMTRHSTFRPFASFVPETASAVVYTDQTKLHRMLVQLAELPRLWGDDVVRGVEILEGLAVLFEHFPASAVYIEQTPQTLVLSGWMREQD